MSEELIAPQKKKFFLVTVSFLCRTIGMELRRTVQFPAFMDIDGKLNMKSIIKLRDDGVRKLGEIFGITAEGGWNITAEAVTPLFIGTGTVEEFMGPQEMVPPSPGALPMPVDHNDAANE